MADKFHSDTQEKIETISYYPSYLDSGDLEAGTKNITATSEATGVANADYSKALTLAKPDDARLVVKRIAARLAVTIDSFDTATILYCRVYVDAQDADHLLFDTSHNAASNKLAAEDTLVGTKEVIFNLLKDGSSHTFYFFFWVNQANNAVISLVRLWAGVGTKQTDYYSKSVLEIDHSGLASIHIYLNKVGTGSTSGRIRYRGQPYRYIKYLTADNPIEILLLSNNDMSIGGTVATDLNYLSAIEIALRSEQ